MIKVTLVNVLFRGMSWKKLFTYIPAQVAGAFFGSMIVYGVYWDAINVFEGGVGARTVPGTASMFATYPLDYMSTGERTNIRVYKLSDHSPLQPLAFFPR